MLRPKAVAASSKFILIAAIFSMRGMCMSMYFFGNMPEMVWLKIRTKIMKLRPSMNEARASTKRDVRNEIDFVEKNFK